MFIKLNIHQVMSFTFFSAKMNNGRSVSAFWLPLLKTLLLKEWQKR